MTYVTTTPCPYNPKRSNTTIDLDRFATDLAKALGAELIDTTYKYYREIRVGADVLHLGANEWKKRVSVSIHAPDVKYGDWSAYDKAQKTESASVNPDGRRIELIARDIKKRVIEANKPALAARRAYAKQQQQNRTDIVTHAAAIKKANPSLDVRVRDGEQKAAVYSGGNGHYVSAYLECDNTVSIERIGSVSAAQFSAIMKILNK